MRPVMWPAAISAEAWLAPVQQPPRAGAGGAEPSALGAPGGVYERGPEDQTS